MRNVYDEEEQLKDLKQECDMHIATAKAMINFLQVRPQLATTIRINDLRLGCCDNESVISLLESEIKEAELCKAGKPNKYE